MKVTVERLGGDSVSLDDFAERHGLEMVVIERPNPLLTGGATRYYAHFKDVEIIDHECLRGACGEGNTADAAIADYARIIGGFRLAIVAKTFKRREVDAPRGQCRPFETGDW